MNDYYNLTLNRAIWRYKHNVRNSAGIHSSGGGALGPAPNAKLNPASCAGLDSGFLPENARIAV